MQNTRPVSDFKNYTEVLKDVKDKQPVYLTKNGRSEYAIVKIDDLDRLYASVSLLAELEAGEYSARKAGWITAAGVEAVLEL